MLLVTGSTGFLGSHVLYALLKEHDRVAALRRPGSGTGTLREIFSCYTPDPDQLVERIDWRVGDLMDKESLINALEGISCVINCAAIVSFKKRDRKRLIDNNVLGTRNLAEAIQKKDGERTAGPDNDKTLLIHISSTSALGDGPGNNPGFLIDEGTMRDPKCRHTGYSESKYLSELMLKGINLDCIILNPGIILGPGQWAKGSSQLFVKAWQGFRYFPYGGTGYIDVREVAGIIKKILSQVSGAGFKEGHPLIGERFCLVGANLRYREFFNLVTDEYGLPNPTVYAGKFMSGLAWRADSLLSAILRRNPLITREIAETAHRISFYSSGKIRNATGYDFRPIEETIGWVAACYQKFIEK